MCLTFAQGTIGPQSLFLAPQITPLRLMSGLLVASLQNYWSASHFSQESQVLTNLSKLSRCLERLRKNRSIAWTRLIRSSNSLRSANRTGIRYSGQRHLKRLSIWSVIFLSMTQSNVLIPSLPLCIPFSMNFAKRALDCQMKTSCLTCLTFQRKSWCSATCSNRENWFHNGTVRKKIERQLS